jgi:hypothetical protein
MMKQWKIQAETLLSIQKVLLITCKMRRGRVNMMNISVKEILAILKDNQNIARL